jgi:hypothetical protein
MEGTLEQEPAICFNQSHNKSKVVTGKCKQLVLETNNNKKVCSGEEPVIVHPLL